MCTPAASSNASGSEPGGSWTSAYSDVTAVALMSTLRGTPAERGASAFLARAQDRWYLALLLVAYRSVPHACDLTAGADGSDKRMAAPLAATLAEYEPIGAFETALLLGCCQHLELADHCHDLTGDLLRQQQASGAWLSSALLRLTHPAVNAPVSVIDAGPSFRDQNAIFTTATVMAALARQAALNE